MKIVFVGLSGVPYTGRACDSRLANIANLLVENCTIEILNRYSSSKNKPLDGISLDPKVQTKEIVISRQTNRFISIIYYCISLILEPFYIIKSNKKEQIDWLHLYSGHYIDFLVYRLIAKIIGAKILYEYVEYRSEKNSKGIYHKINNYLCDFHGAKLWDACFCISNFLINKAQRVNPSLPVTKVTPIGDFELFNSIHKSVCIKKPYVMFCGHAGYFDVVKFIIDSFNTSKSSKTKELLLVLGGNAEQINRVREYDKHCIIMNKIPYEELIAFYKNSFALMIPLRETLEDIARFPNKICEYTAAHGLIVTTQNGEMGYYFENGVNAIVADNCTVASIARRLDELEEGLYNIDEIKDEAYRTGLYNFSIEAYKSSLLDFLSRNL